MIIKSRVVNRWTLFVFTLFSVLYGKTQDLPAGTPSFIRDSLDTYVNQGLKDWQVPGLAVVIVN